MATRILEESMEALGRIIDSDNLSEEESKKRLKLCVESLEEGISNREPVAELQLLGLDTRRINQLEDSQYSIVTIDTLLKRTPSELLEISWLGKQGVDSIYRCLSLYHTLPEIRKRFDPGCYEAGVG